MVIFILLKVRRYKMVKVELDDGIGFSKEMNEKLTNNFIRYKNGEISEEEADRISDELIDEDNRKRDEEIEKIKADAESLKKGE